MEGVWTDKKTNNNKRGVIINTFYNVTQFRLDKSGDFTLDDISHLTVGVNAPDGVGVDGVGGAVEDQGCREQIKTLRLRQRRVKPVSC